MTQFKTNKISFALAVIIAGVLIAVLPSFQCVTACAEHAPMPWNVSVTVAYKNDVFNYDLSKSLAGLEREANERGFYSGYNGKRTLADRLLGAGLPAAAVYEYLLPDFKQVCEHFAYVNRQKIDAKASFSPDGFAYSSCQDGIAIDVDKLFESMLLSRGKRVEVRLPLIVDKAVTEGDLRSVTVKKSSFTTTFFNSSPNRCYNVALAAKAIDGLTVAPCEEFSFNKTVGERSEQNGYKNAKIILDGSYVDGVGGGVCQVSTTLYNALLLAGFIPKASQHTLVSSYVMAGFDAMVSYGSTDLTFVNDTDHNVYIQAKTQGKTITFTIYGEPNEYEIKRENVEERDPFAVKEIVDKLKYPELVYEDQTRVITNGSDGVKTKSYLKYYKAGNLVATRLIRSNNYKRVDKVIARGYLPRGEFDGMNASDAGNAL